MKAQLGLHVSMNFDNPLQKAALTQALTVGDRAAASVDSL
jgi:hypothetical protein